MTKKSESKNSLARSFFWKNFKMSGIKKLLSSATSKLPGSRKNSAVSLRAETTHINIRFENNPKGFYYPNETIDGTVELNVEKAIRVARSLKLTITGVAVCAWKKAKGKRHPVYKGKQVYLEFETQFFGHEDAEPIEVSVGMHLYPFTCKVPAHAVSSYDGTHGSVKYKLTVILDSPSMPDVKFEAPINVLRIESLQDCPWLRCKEEIEHEFQVGILCCETLPLMVQMKIAKIGYALGEVIKISMVMNNQGPAKFKHAVITLDRIELCNSDEPEFSYIKTKKVVVTQPTKSIIEFESINYEEKVQIPEDMPVTSERSCEVFQIVYQLRYTCKSNKMAKVESILPITIAHVPFSELESPDKEETKSTGTQTDCDLQSTPVIEQPRSPLPPKSVKFISDVPAV